MNPKEKATELVFKKYAWIIYFMDKYHAKKCALIAVEEIEKALIDCGELTDELQNMDRELNFWQNVKHEIELI